MPIYESTCPNPQCSRYCVAVEHYYRHAGAAPAACDTCGGGTELLASRFAVVFTGPITARYNDPKSENPHMEGHYVWEKNTPDGKPRQRFIENFDQQRDYCKQEGLLNPKDIGPVEAHSDGKGFSSLGLPGCEV